MIKCKGFLNIITFIIVSTIMVACGKRENTKSNKEIKIGVSLYREDDVFISTISNNLEQIIKENINNYDFKILLEVVDSKGSTLNQGNQIDKFINQNYDVICVNLVDRTAAATIIDKAKSANIPLIFFNREPVEEDMNRWDKLYYVGARAKQSAALQADIVSEEWISNKEIYDKNKDGIIQYVMLEGEPGHQDSLIRTEYSIRSLEEKGIQLEKLADDSANWQSDQASSKMTQWIKEFGDNIELVISNNDVMALGAIHAINSNSDLIRKPIVVGIDGVKDALESIKSGDMNGTVISDSRAQAEAIFEIGMNVAQGKNLEGISNMENGKYKKLSHTKVSKENVEQYLQ